MIGVAAPATDLPIAEELFELFKTPWEPVVAGRHYRLAITCGVEPQVDADTILAYDSPASRAHAATASPTIDGAAVAEFEGERLPLYSGVTRLGPRTSASTLHLDGSALDLRASRDSAGVCRWLIGYNILSEVRYLLSHGQPTQHASNPTLDVHIELLRTLLVRAGVSFVEIPPRPHATDFLCCLTHDVDFFGVRRQRWDRTLAGFVARASVGTFAEFAMRRRPFRDVIRNWAALGSLPFVWLGLSRDFWQPFDDYERADAHRPSTFFLVPTKGLAGRGLTTEQAPRERAVRYQARDIRAEASAAVQRGREIAVHGIDAWTDESSGRRELAEVSVVSGRATAGVRMHWLYFDGESPRQLEKAGFDYDSTWGYNDAIGYRSGTAQAFRWPDTTLMELPLTIMDSAMFSSGRMALPFAEAMALCRGVVRHAKRFGGAIVINWHCRSLAPERLWDQFYQDLLSELETQGTAWFTTAADAVEWFRWRRALRFRRLTEDVIEVTGPRRAGYVATLKVHEPGRSDAVASEYLVDGTQRVFVRLEECGREHVN